MLRLVRFSYQLNKNKSTPCFHAALNFLSSTTPESLRSSSDETEFTPVYKFSYIRMFGLINQVKFYQTAITVVGTPISLVLSTTNFVSTEFGFLVGSLGVSGCILLYTLGFLTHKFVGFVYINPTKTEAKVAYIDFWGRRRDKQLPVNDIIPFSDISSSITDGFYRKFKTYSTDETLRLNLKFGKILDKEGFKTIFIRDV